MRLMGQSNFGSTAMNSYPPLNPLATACIREAAEEVRDVPSLKTLGMLLDKLEMRSTGFVTGDYPLYAIREYIERRIAKIEHAE
jgi:hypothetical protein